MCKADVLLNGEPAHMSPALVENVLVSAPLDESLN
jgi:hypothetical protein